MSVPLNEKNIHFSKQFRKDLRKLDPNSRQMIAQKLKEILRGYVPATLKKLTNYSHANFRLRIGDYRILIAYDQRSGHMEFVRCRHRKDVYDL